MAPHKRLAIGQRIRIIRRSLNMSQTTLSRKVGVSYQQIQKYEYGTSDITVRRLLQIAEALGVPYRILIEGSFTDESAANLLGESDLRIFGLLRKLEEKSLMRMAVHLLEAMAEKE